MIGTGLRDLANRYGMKSAHGIAYGAMDGYCATLSEGAGFKQIVFATRFADASKRYAFTEAVQKTPLQKEYRIAQFAVQEDRIIIVFNDTIGTMKRIESFVAWFLPQLAEYGASKIDTCCHCGLLISEGTWKLVDGVAMYGHDSCARKLVDNLTEQADVRAANGSYLSGTIGAFLGALVGSLAWALVISMGYILSVIGFLIGFLAEKGYSLLKGKNGKGKLVILIFAILLGVLLGYLGGYVLDLSQELDCTLSESYQLFSEAFAEDGEVRGAVFKDLMLGLLFAGLGVYTILKNTKQEVATPKCIDLE